METLKNFIVIVIILFIMSALVFIGLRLIGVIDYFTTRNVIGLELLLICSMIFKQMFKKI